MTSRSSSVPGNSSLPEVATARADARVGRDEPGAPAPAPASSAEASGLDEAASWDARYADDQQVWSGNPNGALVDEVAGLRPARALDVGCGEGADAIWLARQGWAVTALDVSSVALERARAAAAEADVTVTWLHAGLVEAYLPAESFELVSAQYFALPRSPGHDSERALLDAVAPGGTLLAVHHAGFAEYVEERTAKDGHGHDGCGSGRGSGFDVASYVSIDDVRALLDDDWQVDVHEERPRAVPSGAGARHTADVVVRALRRGTAGGLRATGG